MKDNNIERTMADLFTHHLEKAVPEGADLWPVIRARLAERNSTTDLQRRRGLSWFGFRHVRAVSAIAGVLAVVIVLSWWMIPVSADAMEILKKAQDAQVLSTNSGIRTFILTQKINEQSSSGEFQTEIKRWYQEPGLWRVESEWTGTGLTDEDTRIAVSDGTSEWIQQGNSVSINRTTPQPETDDLIPWGRDSAGLTAVLNQVGDVYTSPKLKEEETIAGRLAYVIDLGLPNRFSNSAPEVNNGRRIIWVDKETFFLIKAVQYSPTDGSVIWAMEVTDIQFNIAIDPGIFSFTPPPGAQVHDYRSANNTPFPGPNSPSLTNLAEVRQKVSFSIFIPTLVPAGLVAEHLTVDEGPPNFVRVNYRTEDGSTGLSVLNGPAGSGLAADLRKKGEIIRLRGDIPGHFLNNQPEYGGPILWWEEAGSYVALSGPELNKTDLVKIANSMSSTADIGPRSHK